MRWPWRVHHRHPAGANRLETPIQAIRPAFAASPGRPARLEPGLTTACLSLFLKQSDSPQGMIYNENLSQLKGACLSKHEVLPAIAVRHDHPAKSDGNADGGLASDRRPHEWWRWLNSLSWRRPL